VKFLLLNNNTIISFCNRMTNLQFLKRVVFCSIRIPPLSSFLFHSVYICNFAVLDKQMLENTEGTIRRNWQYRVQYTPSVSTIKLSGPTYSSQNVRQIWESTISKSDYLVGHFGRTWEWILKDFFFTFLEVNISNILWSMRICKRTFFPVCRMCGYVNTLVYFYLAPYSCQER
jgi:hypothetical protein